MINKKDIVSGATINCTIDGHYCHEAKIQIENNIVYICQNSHSGDICNNRFGYKYSWSVSSLNDLNRYSNKINNFFALTNVSDVCLIPNRKWDKKTN